MKYEVVKNVRIADTDGFMSPSAFTIDKAYKFTHLGYGLIIHKAMSLRGIADENMRAEVYVDKHRWVGRFEASGQDVRDAYTHLFPIEALGQSYSRREARWLSIKLVSRLVSNPNFPSHMMRAIALRQTTRPFRDVVQLYPKHPQVMPLG